MSKKRLYIDLVILLFVLIVGYFAVKNAVAIGDWWFFRSYEPSAEVKKLADDAGMSDYGRKLFYRLDPQFVDRREINDKCGSDALGCTVGRNIYILNDFTSKQYNRSVVTAAHEMLHVGYSRISKDALEGLKSALDEQIDLSDPDLVQKFKGFEAEDYYNEGHSYLGTEEPSLTDELQTYYEQYFSDRSKVLEALQYSPEG